MGWSILEITLSQAGTTVGPEILGKSHCSGEPEKSDPVGLGPEVPSSEQARRGLLTLPALG